MNMHNAAHLESPGGLGRHLRACREAVLRDPKQSLLALLPLLMCVPWNPISSTANYEDQLHLAFESGQIFGKRILATYGPLGFLGLPFFHASTFPLLIAFNLAAYGFLIWRLVAMARAHGEPRFGLWPCLVLLPTAFLNPPEWAPVLFVPYVLVLMYVFEDVLAGWKLGWGVASSYAILMACFTLVKLTFAPLILAPLCLCALAEVRARSLPRVALIYAASLAALWLLAGQSFGNVGDFIAYSGQIISGYKDAMGLSETRVAVTGVLILLAQATLWLAATVATWRIGKWAALIVSPVLLLVMYAVFLNGYTRGDPSHAVPCALTTLGLWALLVGWIGMARPHPWLAAASRWMAWPILIAPLVMWPLPGGPPNLGHALYRPIGLLRIALLGTRPLQANAVAGVAKLAPKAVAGLRDVRVDVPMGDPGIAVASGASLMLRPTVTAYSAYTPRLSRANADFLEDPRGPGAVLLKPHFALDEKYPTIEDSLSWLSLLTHFRYVPRDGATYDLFERRAEPLASRLVPLGEQTVSLGEEVAVPSDGDHAIWAEIDLTPNRAGRLLNSAFRPAQVYLTTTLDDDRVEVGRIIVQMAKAGFLLSPYAEDSAVLGSLGGVAVEGRKPHAVRSLKLDAGPAARVLNARRFYEDRATIRFFAVHLDPATPPPPASP